MSQENELGGRRGWKARRHSPIISAALDNPAKQVRGRRKQREWSLRGKTTAEEAFPTLQKTGSSVFWAESTDVARVKPGQSETPDREVR